MNSYWKSYPGINFTGRARAAYRQAVWRGRAAQNPLAHMAGCRRRCAFCGPESLPDGAARREKGECEGGGEDGIDETDFESYIACTNCNRIFGISCINSMHEAVREAYDAVQPPDEVDDELGVWAQLRHAPWQAQIAESERTGTKLQAPLMLAHCCACESYNIKERVCRATHGSPPPHREAASLGCRL